MAQAKSLTTADINKVLNYIAQNKYALRNRAMLLFTVLAGLRVNEVAGLTIADVRNADGSVKCEMYLSANRVKHNNARTVFSVQDCKRSLHNTSQQSHGCTKRNHCLVPSAGLDKDLAPTQ